MLPLVPRTNWRHFPNLREGENQFMGRQITWKKALRAETGNNNNSTRQASSPGLEYRPAFGTRWGLSPLRPSVSPIRINVSSLIVLHLEPTEISYNASNLYVMIFEVLSALGKICSIQWDREILNVPRLTVTPFQKKTILERATVMQLILKLSTKFGRTSHFSGGKFWNKDTSNSFSSAKQFYYI